MRKRLRTQWVEMSWYIPIPWSEFRRLTLQERFNIAEAIEDKGERAGGPPISQPRAQHKI